jgi:hypothetical protein
VAGGIAGRHEPAVARPGDRCEVETVKVREH